IHRWHAKRPSNEADGQQPAVIVSVAYAAHPRARRQARQARKRLLAETERVASLLERRNTQGRPISSIVRVMDPRRARRYWYERGFAKCGRRKVVFRASGSVERGCRLCCRNRWCACASRG